MANFVKRAQRRLDEPVVAATGVQPGGSAGTAGGAGLLVFGIFGAVAAAITAGVHRRSQRKASGLPLTPYMVLALTGRPLHLFHTGSM